MKKRPDLPRTPVSSVPATPRIGWLAVAWIILVLAAGTLLLCPQIGKPDVGAESAPPLRYIRQCFTLPIGMLGTTDLRSYVLMVAFVGIGLATALASRRSEPAAASATSSTVRSEPCIGACNAFTVVGVAMLAWGLLSAFINRSWELSIGWWLTAACGVLWASWLSRCVTPAQVARALVGAALVAAVALGATLAHRAQLGFRYVRWPIGPLTTTAVMSALWSAAGVAGLAALVTVPCGNGGSSLRVGRLLAPVLLLALALPTLFITGRRGALLASVASTLFVVVMSAWRRWPKRRGLFIAAVVAAAAAGGAFVWRQSTNPQREVSGPLALRYVYWQEMAHSISRWWLFGVGPDMFAPDMATASAMSRAEMPHVVHGSIERSAHNEWFQAFYELGLVGGLLYVALPLMTMAAAWRAFLRSSNAMHRATLLALMAALASILVSESSSINLRHAVLPVWYWTILGLTLAAARGRTEPTSCVDSRWMPRPAVGRLLAGVLALIVLLQVVNDVQANRARAMGTQLLGRDDEKAIGYFEIGTGILGAENWLKARFELGVAQSNRLRELTRQGSAAATQPAAEDRARVAAAALDAWGTLYRRCAGFPDAGSRFAEALVNAGRRDDARQLLADYLKRLNPYDAPGNLLFAHLFAESPAEKIACAERAARAAGVDLIEGPMQRWLADPAVAAQWQQHVRDAETDVTTRLEPQWSNPLAPETLRIEAARLAALKQIQDAARLQALAAKTYGQLYTDNNPHRRAHRAEQDAWTRAAQYAFDADPGAPEQAWQLAREAERFAVLGIEHEYLARPNLRGEFVGDVVIPVELPDHLRPLWRTSAKMFLAVGREKDADVRILSAAPADLRGSVPALQAFKQQLARELVAAFSTLPAGRRPANFQRLEQLATMNALK